MRGGIGNAEFCNDFLQGMKDCQRGERAENQSEAYNRGYDCQMEVENED